MNSPYDPPDHTGLFLHEQPNTIPFLFRQKWLILHVYDEKGYTGSGATRTNAAGR